MDANGDGGAAPNTDGSTATAHQPTTVNRPPRRCRRPTRQMEQLYLACTCMYRGMRPGGTTSCSHAAMQPSRAQRNSEVRTDPGPPPWLPSSERSWMATRAADSDHCGRCPGFKRLQAGNHSMAQVKPSMAFVISDISCTLTTHRQSWRASDPKMRPAQGSWCLQPCWGHPRTCVHGTLLPAILPSYNQVPTVTLGAKIENMSESHNIP